MYGIVLTSGLSFLYVSMKHDQAVRGGYCILTRQLVVNYSWTITNVTDAAEMNSNTTRVNNWQRTIVIKYKVEV